MSDAPIKEVVELGRTPNGKVIEFVRQGRVARLQFSSGGQLPESLQGGWTDTKNAQSAVNAYLKSLETEDKTEVDGQTGKRPARKRRSS